MAIGFKVYRTHLGNTFTDAAGVRCDSWQLVDEKGQAEAIADFEGGNLKRFQAIDFIKPEASGWCLDLKQRNYPPENPMA